MALRHDHRNHHRRAVGRARLRVHPVRPRARRAAPVLVIGMHRSGTSAVTQALESLGLDAGRDPLMAATEDNPTGLFEVGRLTGLDDEVLDAVGGRWAAPPDATPAEVAALASTPLGDRARALAAEIFPDPRWVWKDPRVSLLLPFWRAVLSPEPAAVVVVRHPLEVAGSLRARDGIAVEYGLALWERYTRCLLRDLRGMQVIVLDYATAVADPEAAMGDVMSFLVDADLSPEGLEPERGAAAFADAHRRQRATARDLAEEPAVTDELRALYATASELMGAHAAFPVVELGPETPRLQIAFDEHKRMSRYEERVASLVAELERQGAQIGELRDEIDRRSAHATEIVTDLERERDELAARLIALETWWPALTALRIRRVLHRVSRRPRTAAESPEGSRPTDA